MLKKLLALRRELRFSVSNKGGDFVVMTQTMHKDLAHRCLSDEATYGRSSSQTITALNRCEIPGDACYASFDAVSLYTNVNNTEAINAVLELLHGDRKEIHTFGMTEEDIQALLETILECNILQFDGVFYAQKRGLAMGLWIAPLLAIVYLDHIERRSLTQELYSTSVT
ncbi:unnamed protein product [Heligmosomoides polygyrus]|uniref:Reverse transcriptase domain-containing protein n=1 Tax=Heligmosomoides polygyrus TaxID=6339 RepID=A0A183FRI6_HELPZ|nr:unnamed protein product [Heligmosomoides polygyrus]